MTEPHVALRGVGKRFGGVQALTGIDLEIGRSTIHALVGENGAGKSTLGKIIVGVHRPDVGEVIVDGRTVAYHSPRDALADGLTIIAQEPTLVPFRTVLENVFLGIETRRFGVVDTRAMRRRYAELVDRTQLDLPAGAIAGSLSVADKQKAEILRAIARDVRLVVMDEPTSALTSDEAERLFEIARRLRDGGTTIIYVSHFLEEVLGLVDTVTVLRDGHHVRTGLAAEESPASLVQAMLGRPMSLVFPAKAPPPVEAPIVLSVSGLSRTGAIEDVSFEVRAGEIVGLAGLIGSGRSEVARAIFGADRLESGTISLDGEPISVRTPRDAVRRGIVMLPEDRKSQGLLMLRSIVDNVTLPHLAGVTTAGVIETRRERRRAGELIDRVDVRAKTGVARVSTLSGGNQQKVLFAKWLLERPRVFIADEPTRGVDVGAKQAIYELIRQLASEGMAVVLISSEHAEVLGLAHRVLVMREGRIVAEFDGETMTEDVVLHAAFATGEAVGA
ncbi:MAG: sugar ABC transporter ATP-binding protein [Actinobacteria bacterium]|nr:sugar ABC transporter ATP-binding protein [Actinomycetota bacterium]